MAIGDISVFKGTIKKIFCNKETFKACSVSVDEIEQGVLLKHPVFNTVSLHGDFQEVEVDCQYEIEATYEGENQYGHQYKVLSISMPKPTTPQQVQAFLSEFISVKRAEEIVKVYPDIIDRILKGEEIDVSKLTGIGEKSIESIKSKIMDNIAILDLHKEFGKFGFSFSILRKMLQRYKNVDNATYHIKKNPYDALTDIKGIGFIKADEIALKINPQFISSIERMVGCIRYYLEENENNGNSYMDSNMLYSECMTHVKESIAYFNMALEDDSLYYEADTNRVARAFVRKREEYIAKTLIEMNRETEKWDIDVEQYRTVDGFDLTDEQMGTLKSVCEYGITCLIGGGGMGKSSSIEALVNMLEANCKSYKLMTPTAKSADVLSDFTHREARTAHRHLGYNGEGFESNEQNPMEVDVIIFDEFSMCDIWLFNSLLLATKTKSKIVLVGDSWQLPSIGAGNLLYDITTSGVINVVELTKVFRYGDGGLMKVVTDVRNGLRFLDNGFTGNKVFGANQDFCYIELDQDYIVGKTLQFYKKLLDNGNSIEDILVVTSKNVSKFGTVEINKQIQRMLQENQDNESMVINDNLTLYLGDKVKQKVNNYDIQKVIKRDNGEISLFEEEQDEIDAKGEVYNGQTGIITYIDNVQKLIHVRIKGVEYIYKKDMINEQLSLGYCTTIHSAQGMSINYVIALMPKADTYMMNSNSLYTAMTRARKRCYLLGNIYTINNAIRKKINFERNTFTGELLREYSKKVEK